MLGKTDGIRLLDVSADGFWTSFYAMLFALPPIFLSWVAFANDLGQTPDIYGSKSLKVVVDRRGFPGRTMFWGKFG